MPYGTQSQRNATKRIDVTNWLCVLMLAFVLLAAQSVPPVHAATGPLCYVNASAGGSNNGNSWTNAYVDLQSALTDTNCFTIWVAQGTYKPSATVDPADPRTATYRLKNGVSIYGGFFGNEETLGQRRPLTYVTTLSGDIGTAGTLGDNVYHVVTADATNATAVLDGFNITAGYASAVIPDNTGAGLFIRSSSPTLANMTFSGNVATLFGGGMSHTDSSATLTNVTFTGNSASIGGAMWNGYASHPTLTNVTFSGNSGGAMYNTDDSSLTLTNVTSSGNAGIAVNNYDTSIALIYDSIFWADGAEIVNTSGTTVRDSIVQGGYACTGCAHIVNLDPLLASLANNGGYTRTMALGSGSPAIDAGNNATCASTDQRGRPRPVDGDHNGTVICDMGAFEVPVFTDMPVAGKEWMEDWVNIFYQHGITTGCNPSPLSYCPEDNVTRAEMAVFLLRAKHGGSYTPPAPTHDFADVPVTGKEWMEPWIEQFYAEGITTGCGGGNYCPENNVTRAEMAVFVLRALHGGGYTPPALSHFFSDMPVIGKEWMEPWVDEFYREGVTTGCGSGNYCPENNVTRAEMAVFIGRAYHFYP